MNTEEALKISHAVRKDMMKQALEEEKMKLQGNLDTQQLANAGALDRTSLANTGQLAVQGLHGQQSIEQARLANELATPITASKIAEQNAMGSYYGAHAANLNADTASNLETRDLFSPEEKRQFGYANKGLPYPGVVDPKVAAENAYTKAAAATPYTPALAAPGYTVESEGRPEPGLYNTERAVPGIVNRFVMPPDNTVKPVLPTSPRAGGITVSNVNGAQRFSDTSVPANASAVAYPAQTDAGMPSGYNITAYDKGDGVIRYTDRAVPQGATIVDRSKYRKKDLLATP